MSERCRTLSISYEFGEDDDWESFEDAIFSLAFDLAEQRKLLLAGGSKPELVKLADYQEALSFYAEPDTYHAIGFFADPPCGEFDDDFSEGHGDPNYDRPMPGKRARIALGWEKR